MFHERVGIEKQDFRKQHCIIDPLLPNKRASRSTRDHPRTAVGLKSSFGKSQGPFHFSSCAHRYSPDTPLTLSLYNQQKSLPKSEISILRNIPIGIIKCRKGVLENLFLTPRRDNRISKRGVRGDQRSEPQWCPHLLSDNTYESTV